MNHTYVTLCGLVATEPRLSVHNNLPITSFRLVATSRRYDPQTSTWVDGESTWVTVTCFRGLATNAIKSLSKRDRVIVHGRLATREWGEPRRVSVELEADGIGHDLTFGISSFTRTVGGSSPRPAEDSDLDASAQGEAPVDVDEDAEGAFDLTSVEREEAFAGAPPF